MPPAPGASTRPDQEHPQVSAVIPVLNGGSDLRRLLAMLHAQQDVSLECVIVDSGSNDGSLQTAKQFGAQIVQIRPEEFSHAGTRNLGASYAQGRYLFFTVQDALPPSRTWLANMIRVAEDAGAVGTTCTEYPRSDCDLFYRMLNERHRQFMGAVETDRLLGQHTGDEPLEIRRSAQLHSMALLIRREIFTRYRFEGDFAEDLSLGLRLLADGLRVVMPANLRIIHSHNRHPYYHLKRGFVDTLAMERLIPGTVDKSGSPEYAARNVIAGYTAVRRFAAGCLDRKPLPIPLEKLASNTNEGDADTQPIEVTLRQDQMLDEKTKQFLMRLLGNCDDTSELQRSDAARAMFGAMRSIIDQLSNQCDEADQHIVDEIVECSYKFFALLAGAGLASAWLNDSGRAHPLMSGVHRELIGGV